MPVQHHREQGLTCILKLKVMSSPRSAFYFFRSSPVFLNAGNTHVFVAFKAKSRMSSNISFVIYLVNLQCYYSLWLCLHGKKETIDYKEELAKRSQFLAVQIILNSKGKFITFKK